VIVAAVPVKDLSCAKQRLVPFLARAERRALAIAMLEDVLGSLLAASLDAVWVVTGDQTVMAIVRAHGATPLPQEADRGHSEAVAVAQEAAAAAGADRFLTVPGDVPAVTPEEIRTLCVAVPGRGVAFAPSVSGFGTNAALLAPPDLMPLKFGEPSFANHVEAARERGLVPTVVSLPGLALDLDTPEDLALLLERDGAPRTRALLHALRARARLGGLG
jgi:2-phospho-L-lactate guanylyltransferase